MEPGELKALAERKFRELIEQPFLDDLTSHEITIFMAHMARQAAEYAADEHDF